MFDKIQSRIIIILGLSGVFGCMASLFLLSRVSSLELKFPIEKDKILSICDGVIAAERLSHQPLIKKSYVSSNQEVLIYLQKSLGVKETNNLLGSLPLYYWQIDYYYQKDRGRALFFDGKRKSVRVVVEPIHGEVIGFSHFVPAQEYKYLNTLSKKESEKISQSFLNSIGFDISRFKMTRYSSLEKKYIFEWEKDVSLIKKAKLKARLEILGDRVASFSYFIEIPPEELKKYGPKRILDLLFFALKIVLLIFGIFVLVAAIMKRKVLEWKFGLVFALLISPVFLITLFRRQDYTSPYRPIFFSIYILMSIVYFFWTQIQAAIARLFSRESKIKLFPIKMSSSILLSYIFVFTAFGFAMLLFIFILKIFKPVAALGLDSFFSSFPSFKFYCLIAPLLSLSAAVSEEIFFRALLISFFKKYLRISALAVILSSVFWSFLHVAPTIDSDIYPAFVKGIMLLPVGFLFGYIFLRFGIICAVTTHYLYDLIVIGSAILEFNNYRHIKENVILLLLAAILPLFVLFIRTIANYKENDA